MEIGLREWLILIGVIVILVILFDGWRRMRGGKGKLKIQLDQNVANLSDEHDEETSRELLGPARVVSRARGEPMLDDDLPSISTGGREREPLRTPTFSEPSRSADDFDLTLLDEESEPASCHAKAAPREQAQAFSKKPAEEGRTKKELPPVEEVLVINVICRDAVGFRGPALLQNILESGLRFGDMNIFHRHESMTGNGEVLFSMANAVKPGTFDLDDIDHFTTPAVSFFLGLPGPRHPKQAFDLMLAATRKLSQELNGELKDDQRSVMTTQTIEHYRQRMAEFERRQMTLKR